MKSFFFSLCLPLLALAADQPIVVQNANILTVTKGTIKGSIVVENGKIKEVGEKVSIPANAKIVDASGQFVLPGIIDSHSHIAADSINEGSISVSSMVRIEDVLNPEDVAIYRALAGGVTMANILHGSANAIGGQSSVIKLRWGKPAEEMPFDKAPPSIKFALGENPKRQGNPTGGRVGAGNTANLRYPATRMGIEDVYVEAFTRAKEYQQTWKDYEAKKAKGEVAMPPRRDLQLEPLVEILEGKRLVHIHAYRSDEILMMIRVAERVGFQITTFQHILEGYKVAKEMVQHGVAGAGFSDWWAYKIEAYDAIPYNMALMTRKGVLAGVNSDSADTIRRLNTEAAKAMKYGGLTEEEALRLITINPAMQIKVDKWVGSIEPGKDADFVIWDKHPLSSYARAQQVYIDGVKYFDRDQDASDHLRLAAAKKALEEKLKQEQRRQAPPAGAVTRRPQ
ncbi:amidohydrolase [Bryobacter aggregatus]|uniref:amidohydrolase n=1 Tax=Bryobacter aggregatus TaxID=360054 RepID=UPI0004E0B289|nr:amidohydrolase [Bryobacter aggregatus]